LLALVSLGIPAQRNAELMEDIAATAQIERPLAFPHHNNARL
jgi:hypothetical protein